MEEGNEMFECVTQQQKNTLAVNLHTQNLHLKVFGKKAQGDAPLMLGWQKIVCTIFWRVHLPTSLYLFPQMCAWVCACGHKSVAV